MIVDIGRFDEARYNWPIINIMPISFHITLRVSKQLPSLVKVHLPEKIPWWISPRQIKGYTLNPLMHWRPQHLLTLPRYPVNKFTTKLPRMNVCCGVYIAESKASKTQKHNYFNSSATSILSGTMRCFLLDTKKCAVWRWLTKIN